MSCDLLPSETPGPHYQGSVFEVIAAGWDLMIAHPPCTYLANSGVRWLYGGKGTERDEARWRHMEAASLFFQQLLETRFVERVAVENPVMHRHAGIRKPDQIVQPWWFGEGESKATGLWLRNLPLLTATNVVEGRMPRVHREPPSPDRWKNRSRTYLGLAEAMAEQWAVA